MSASFAAVKDFHLIPIENQERYPARNIRLYANTLRARKAYRLNSMLRDQLDDANNMLHITTANLGDSSAYIVIVDNNKELVHFSRLNNMHNPDER